jgi:hypothetical protein
MARSRSSVPGLLYEERAPTLRLISPSTTLQAFGNWKLLHPWHRTRQAIGFHAQSQATSPNAHIIRVAYAAAATSAVIAGSMFRPEPFRSALEGFLMIGIVPLGLLGIARRASRGVRNDTGSDSVLGSPIWIVVCAVIFGLFLLLQARGLGSTAAPG